MIPSTLLLLLLLLFPTVLAQCPDILTLTDKVINGNPSIPSYHISLSSPPNPAIRRCTASRIASQWAITAAHCNVNSSWTATIAGHTIFDGTDATVLEVFTHPQYNQPTDRRFDIALVKLDTSSTGPFVMLNDHPALPMPDAFVRVAGYGAIDSSATPQHGNLTHVDIPTVEFQQCKRLYQGTPNLGILDKRKQMCAGYMQGGCDACSGDSGGPVVQFDKDGNPVQVALVSASRGCALPDFPGIGVRVDAFLPWIRELGVQLKTGRGMQVMRASGGRFVTKDPPSDVTQEDNAPSPAPSVRPSPSASPIVVNTPKPPPPPPKSPTTPNQGNVNRSPTPTPSQIRETAPEKPKKEKGVGKPIGPRLPPIEPAPGEETLDGVEEDDELVASEEPDGETGALAGDVSVGPEVSGKASTGAIAGGVVGGLVLVALTIAGFLFLYRNRDQVATESDTADTQA